jgi:hypothetical protein
MVVARFEFPPGVIALGVATLPVMPQVSPAPSVIWVGFPSESR